MDLYRELDSTSEIRRGRHRWLENVARMPEERAVKNITEGKSYVEKPSKKCLDDFENDLKKMVDRG
jgi:hypothetical protein